MSDEPATEGAPRLAEPADLREVIAVLKRQAAALAKLAKAVSPPDPGRLDKALAALERAGTADVGAIGASARAWLAHEKDGRGRRLRAELGAACAARGVELVVLTREPLEVRLPPVSVRIDVDADKAEIAFGQQGVERCGAQAGPILAARDKALAALEGKGWDPTAFHQQLRQAWERAGGEGWVEMTDVLSELVWARQSAKFRLDPRARNFEDYPRARFLYDLWRLRRDRALSSGGWRLSLGPATGGSVRDKRRVMWVEDDRGQGQWHLTLRFVKDEAPAHA